MLCLIWGISRCEKATPFVPRMIKEHQRFGCRNIAIDKFRADFLKHIGTANWIKIVDWHSCCHHASCGLGIPSPCWGCWRWNEETRKLSRIFHWLRWVGPGEPGHSMHHATSSIISSNCPRSAVRQRISCDKGFCIFLYQESRFESYYRNRSKNLHFKLLQGIHVQLHPSFFSRRALSGTLSWLHCSSNLASGHCEWEIRGPGEVGK